GGSVDKPQFIRDHSRIARYALSASRSSCGVALSRVFGTPRTCFNLVTRRYRTQRAPCPSQIWLASRHVAGLFRAPPSILERFAVRSVMPRERQETMPIRLSRDV